MPVSAGRLLSNSVNASSPPAEAPTPTTRGSDPSPSPSPSVCCTMAAAGCFGLGDSGRARLAGARLPTLFAKFANYHHFLSLRNEQASSLEPRSLCTQRAKHPAESQMTELWCRQAIVGAA